MISRFALAPMDGLLRVLTVVCFAIPAVMGTVAATTRHPIDWILGAVAVLIAASYGVIWLALRPRAFVITPDALELEWPIRKRSIPREAIVSVTKRDKAELARELGRMMRIGAGGVWGGFGQAATARGRYELWISRTDWMIVIECEGRRGLLVTPDDPDRFVAELASRARASSRT